MKEAPLQTQASEESGVDLFKQKGFLSEIMPFVPECVRKRNTDWFDLAESLSDCLQSIAMNATETIGGKMIDPKVLATLLLLRSASQIQAAILLAERGMVVEANVMVRCILENALCVGALHDNPEEFIQTFQDDDAASRKGLIACLLDKELVLKGTDRAKTLEKIKQEIGKKSTFSPKGIAALSGLDDLYLLYKKLSNDFSHPSVTALQRYLNMNSDGDGWSGYIFGIAGDEEIKESLDAMILSSISIGMYAFQLIDNNEGKKKLGVLSKKYENLKFLLTTNKNEKDSGFPLSRE